MLETNYQAISPNTIKVRNRSEWIECIISTIILIILYTVTNIFQWWGWLHYVWGALFAFTWLSLLWNIRISSPLYFKTFRYALNDEFVYIQQGIWFRKETIIPMTKIQSIETTQGPLMKKFGVRSVEIKTINGQLVIPHLEENVALNVRDHIAMLAQLKELDEI